MPEKSTLSTFRTWVAHFNHTLLDYFQGIPPDKYLSFELNTYEERSLFSK